MVGGSDAVAVSGRAHGGWPVTREEYSAAAAHLDLPHGDPTGGCCDEAGAAIRGYVGELEREVERLHEVAVNAHADALVQQTALKGMTVEEGAVVLELGPTRELVIAFVHAAREMLGDAENYSETRIDFPSVSMEFKAAGEYERYALVVQRAGKLTPHEARRKAEAERDEALAQVAAVRALCADAMKLPTMEDPRPADDRVSPRAVLAALDGASQ